MVLCMHSITLYLSHLFITLKKNLTKIVHFLIYCTQKTHFCLLWEERKIRHTPSNLLYYHLVTSVSFRKSELLVLFHMGLHRNETSSEQ